MNLNIKQLRGYKQPGFLLGFVAYIKWLKQEGRLLDILQYRRYRQDQADKIEWINGLPDHLFEALDWKDLEIVAYPHRDTTSYRLGHDDDDGSEPMYYGSSPYWVATRIARRKRREEIQRRWDARKLAHATVKAPAARRVVRL